MNLAIALSAARYGGAIANYTEVVHLLKTKDEATGQERVCGARCRDVITGEAWPRFHQLSLPPLRKHYFTCSHLLSLKTVK